MAHQRSDKKYFHSSLDGMLVHCKDISIIKFAATHFYTWVYQGGERHCESKIPCQSKPLYAVILSELDNLEDVSDSLRVDERS